MFARQAEDGGFGSRILVENFGSARDRHAAIHAGTIDAEQLAAVCAAANTAVVLETPPDSQAADIAWLRNQLDQ